MSDREEADWELTEEPDGGKVQAAYANGIRALKPEPEKEGRANPCGICGKAHVVGAMTVCG